MPFDARTRRHRGLESLQAGYREYIPVIEIDGLRAFTYFVSAEALLDRLGD